jgi:hypothetical protein
MAYYHNCLGVLYHMISTITNEEHRCGWSSDLMTALDVKPLINRRLRSWEAVAWDMLSSSLHMVKFCDEVRRFHLRGSTDAIPPHTTLYCAVDLLGRQASSFLSLTPPVASGQQAPLRLRAHGHLRSSISSSLETRHDAFHHHCARSPGRDIGHLRRSGWHSSFACWCHS